VNRKTFGEIIDTMWKGKKLTIKQTNKTNIYEK